MKRQPTVTDVARAAGVSRQTVSNVLNAPDVVRESTRLRVLRAIETLGYRPNASARRLRSTRSLSIGVRIGPDPRGTASSFLGPFLTALLLEGQRRQVRILPFVAEDTDEEINAYARLIGSGETDGFVLTSTRPADSRIEWLQNHSIPFVSFGRPSKDGAPWVDVDGVAGARLATRSLLGAGAKRVAFLSCAVDTQTMHDRRTGWLEAMQATSATPDELDSLTRVLNSSEEQEVLLQLAGADAVVCTSDTLALKVRDTLGPAVPVTGYDDSPLARSLAITSIAQHLDRVAAALLIALQCDTPMTRVVVEPTLVVHAAA